MGSACAAHPTETHTRVTNSITLEMLFGEATQFDAAKPPKPLAE